MKAILKPEEERKVTPGPDAVEDLLSLEKKVHVIPSCVLKQLITKDRTTVMERQEQLRVSLEVLLPDEVPVPNCNHLQAVVRAEDQGGYLASAALSFAILRRLRDIDKLSDESTIFDAYVSNEKKLLGALVRNHPFAYWQNTLVDWDDNKIIHYPIQSDYKGKCPIPINVQRDTYPLIIPPDTYEKQYTNADLPVNARSFLIKLLGVYSSQSIDRFLSDMGLDLTLEFPEPSQRTGITGVTFKFANSHFSIRIDESLDHYRSARKVVRL